ncbi:hypothetical protein [Sinomonas terrae]|uniref:Uncharacterized protein n=1 Tax=Sinomonas terrae TaxID=2908838 RepID=A0ABS9U4L3_9MICC|nr:hypothetical protein [Sinomonas terrae]MCH6471628.1 hypothetical protein [Sinomonas terrae]
MSGDQSGSPTPSPSASASAQPSKHAGKHAPGQVNAETLHGQMTVKKANGNIETVFVQRGTVTDANKQVHQDSGEHRQKWQSGTPSPSPSKVSPSPSSTS